ncbi:early nodulin-20-like [Leopardus geoffroyi]|uniref:early nodulin-20-like n=1 Tax=Leopardus geoffroyi TaxID=46844 RepID=UPI001E2626A5|nr:early nodulin-20-like [Leopardus geoffroyi]
MERTLPGWEGWVAGGACFALTQVGRRERLGFWRFCKAGLRSKLSISTAQIKRTIPSSSMTRPETCPQPPSPASSRAVRRWERRLGPHSPKGRFPRRPEAGPGSGRRAPGPRPRKGAWVGAVPAAERRLQATPPPSRRQHAAPPGSAPSRLPPARRAHAWGGMEAAPRQPR